MGLGRQPVAPCSHQIARCATISTPWPSHYGPSPICLIVCLKAGLPPRRYGFSLCSWVSLLTYHRHFWTWTTGGIWQKEWVWFVPLSLCPICGLVLYPTPVGSSLLATSIWSDTIWEIMILVAWSRFPIPHTSLASTHYNPFPHISHLCPHFPIGSTRI